MTNQHVLTGLDGSNPLAFLAALGVLVALDDARRAEGVARPRLSWRREGVWRPVVHDGAEDLDEIVALLDADRQSCAKDPVLGFTYDKKGKPAPDLKASPAELREALMRWVGDAAPDHRRSVDWIVGLVSEGALDNNGACKPTALHFTAGQQLFLKAALALAEGVTADDLKEAIEGPWRYSSKLPVMGWDNTEARDYALRATNPSGDQKAGNAGADWLALRGLTLVPNASRAGRQRTAGVTGGWKSGRFAWPVWSSAVTREVAQALVTTPRLVDLKPEVRDRRGIAEVMEVRILRSDQGGYGSVTPAGFR